MQPLVIASSVVMPSDSRRLRLRNTLASAIAAAVCTGFTQRQD